MSEVYKEKLELERLEYDKMCMRQECLRRAIEACTHSVKTFAEVGKYADVPADITSKVIKSLSDTVEKANTQLQTDLDGMK